MEAADADRTVARAVQAAKELAKQHANLEAPMAATAASNGPKGKGAAKSQDARQGKTSKQLKPERFFEKQRQQANNS
eukprot:2655570-Pyramimonas_sp.AAC.1